MVNLLIPWLQRFLFNGNLIREGLRFTLEIVPNDGELFLLRFHPFLHPSDLGGCFLDLCRALLSGDLRIGYSTLGRVDRLLQLLLFPVQKLSLLLKFDLFLIELCHLFENRLRVFVEGLTLLLTLLVLLFELFDAIFVPLMLL